MSPSDDRSWNHVFDEEKRHVSSRHIGEMPVEQNLVGLAISGGGIRSATFGLGVLEGLKQRGLLKRFDYLSTVSGGGYIGSWLSANCKRAADRTPKNPGDRTDPAVVGWLDERVDWKPSIDYLRRYSNYLSPRVGFFSADTWSMGAIWLRNTLLVQLTVVLAMAVVLLVPRFLFQGFVRWPSVGHWRWTSVVLYVVAIAGIAGNQMRLTSRGRLSLLKATNWKTGLGAAVACLLTAIAIAVAGDFAPFANGPIDYRLAVPISFLLVLAGFFGQPVAVKLVNVMWRAWGDEAPPEEVNYTQSWAQGVVVLPMMVTSYLVAAVLWGQSTNPDHPLARLDTFGGFLTQGWRYWPLPLAVAFASVWILSIMSRRREGRTALLVALFAPVPTILVLHALLSVIMVVLHGWAAQTDEGPWLALMWAPSLVLYAFGLSVIVLVGMMGRQLHESVREWWSRLGAWLGIYGFAWTLIAVAGVYGPKWAATILDGSSWQGSSAVVGWLATTVAGLLAGKSESTGGGSKAGSTAPTTPQRAMDVVAAIGPFVFIAGLMLGVSTALHLIILSISVDVLPSLTELHVRYWMYLNQSHPMVELVVLAAAAAGVLLLADRIDINEFSLNAFYRSRLSRCYLGAARLPEERHPQNFTGFDNDDDLRMAELGTTASPPAGPLHIVNCALNLGGSSDLALHSRHSASFTVTPYFAGSGYLTNSPGEEPPSGCYERTSQYGGEHGQPTLGQAISVSGAAASPNMGYHTSPVVAFLLTVFNVRLGWWFPNPKMPGIRSASPWFSLRYLLMELFGGADDTSQFLMISDGGHFENLAAYELVRRKCRVIVISDAEADPEMHFAGLGTLIRMCEVDFGASIAIDVGAIRPDPQSTWSNRRHAIGRIDYGEGTPEGILIYLKASMTGKEDSAIQQYKATHATFPHESTADQFYGEDQFESYRHLGQEVVGEVFAAVGSRPDGDGFVTAANELLIKSWTAGAPKDPAHGVSQRSGLA
jgi:hypothetical protein